MKRFIGLLVISLALAGCVPVNPPAPTTQENANSNPSLENNVNQNENEASSIPDLLRSGEIARCNIGSECIRVSAKGCCGCGTRAINKKYQKDWNDYQDTLKECPANTPCLQVAERCGTEPDCSDSGECYLK